VKIMRSLISERAVSPSSASVKLSLRGIAVHLGADDMTVRYRYNKLQKSGGGSIRTGIEKLGVPLANGFADGLREGRLRSAPRQQNQGAKNPAQEQVVTQEANGGSTTQSDQTDLGKLNNDELVNTLGEAQKAEKVVENAKKQLVQEANRRGLKI
jgi:hypothetical protein